MKVVRVNLEERKIDFELIDKGSNYSQIAETKGYDKRADERSKKTKSRKSGAKKSKTKNTGGQKSLTGRSKLKARRAAQIQKGA